MNTIDALHRERVAKEFRDDAWRNVANSEDGKIVIADILARCHHFQVVNDPDHKVLQQFAIELLRTSGLYPEERGSFPLDYVSMLSKTKLNHDAWARDTVPAPKFGWFRRLFERKTK